MTLPLVRWLDRIRPVHVEAARGKPGATWSADEYHAVLTYLHERAEVADLADAERIDHDRLEQEATAYEDHTFTGEP